MVEIKSTGLGQSQFLGIAIHAKLSKNQDIFAHCPFEMSTGFEHFDKKAYQENQSAKEGSPRDIPSRSNGK